MSTEDRLPNEIMIKCDELIELLELDKDEVFVPDVIDTLKSLIHKYQSKGKYFNILEGVMDDKEFEEEPLKSTLKELKSIWTTKI